MHLFHIPQYTIQNRNVHISVLNGVLWDMEQIHWGICEIDLLLEHSVYCWFTIDHEKLNELQKKDIINTSHDIQWMNQQKLQLSPMKLFAIRLTWCLC